jgi:hypothetical protein
MDDIDRNEREPLAEGLEALPEGAFDMPRPPEELRTAVLERTIRIVRGRARRRRLLILALAAAAYLGGLTTALLLTETAATNGNGRQGVAEVQPGAVDFAGNPAGNPEAKPADLERQAESATPEERILLLTRAGDLYLSAQCDVERALDCYRRALDAMPAVRRTAAAPGDSWLLAALKDSRR